MARDGRPKKAQNISLCEEQRAILELISSRTLGRPGLSPLIRAALDEFIASQVRRDPALEAEVLKLRANGGALKNVVSIRAVPDEGGGA